VADQGIVENRAVESRECLRFFSCLVNQGRLDKKKNVTDFSNTCGNEWIDDSAKALSAGFIEYFTLLKDPRSSKKTSHSLLEIIFTTVCAYVCGANSWEGVLEFARAREVWLKKYIDLENGIPFDFLRRCFFRMS
jgi:hypothetical protein